jgi:GMP synthase PP-ATPase subunit
LAEPYLKMVKKGVDGASVEGSPDVEIEALKNRLERMEGLLQEQSKELKAEVISSQQSMKLEIKDQMDEFFTRLMKVQTSNPSPQPAAIESFASMLVMQMNSYPTELISQLHQSTLPPPLINQPYRKGLTFLHKHHHQINHTKA